MWCSSCDRYRSRSVSCIARDYFDVACSIILSPDDLYGYVDCFFSSERTLADRLKAEFPGVDVIAEHKADRTYVSLLSSLLFMMEIDMDKPVVSAASIIAKVERDRTLRELEQKVLSDMHRSSRILKCRAARAAARIRISFGSNHQSFLSKIGINLKGALHNKFFFLW